METTELTRRIGQRIRASRKRCGWSLSELSKHTNGALSKSRLGNYEQGLRRPGHEEACLLAATFGTVSPSWLLCLDDDSGALNDQETTLLRSFRAADARGRGVILTVARVLPSETAIAVPADSRYTPPQR
jgi:transcriptional regulator with XRE-family HTH domain